MNFKTTDVENIIKELDLIPVSKEEIEIYVDFDGQIASINDLSLDFQKVCNFLENEGVFNIEIPLNFYDEVENVQFEIVDNTISVIDCVKTDDIEQLEEYMLNNDLTVEF